MSALWVAFRAWPLARQIIAGFAVVALAVGIWHYFDGKDARRIEKVEQGAVAKERATNAIETIQTVEKANEAEQAVTRDVDARIDVCLRYATNPENCR